MNRAQRLGSTEHVLDSLVLGMLRKDLLCLPGKSLSSPVEEEVLDAKGALYLICNG